MSNIQIHPLIFVISPLLYIFMVDGVKGGVGKSTYARVLAQWIIDNNRRIVGVDCDRYNQSFADFYSDTIPVEYAYFTEDQKQAWQADHILEVTCKSQTHCIADLPAQTYNSQVTYFKNGGLRAAKRRQIQFIKFFLCAGYYSAEQFVTSVSAFGQEIPHVLVLNEGLCDDFSFLDDYEEFQALIETQKIPVIRLPEISYRECEVIKTFQLTYAQAVESEQLTLTGQQRVADFLFDTYEQLDQLGLFDHENKK